MSDTPHDRSPQEWVSVGVIAQAANLHRTTIDNYRKSGRIPAHCLRRLPSGVYRYELSQTLMVLDVSDASPETTMDSGAEIKAI
jgi:hypothetical protein